MTARNASRFIFALLVMSWLLFQPTAVQANPFDERIAPLQVGDRLPARSFVDQRGQAQSFTELGGKTAIVGFIFTRCKDICPLTTQRFLELDRQLGQGAYVLALVTIDPAHDTLPVIAAYAAKYHVVGRTHILTGRPQAVLEFVRSAGISVIDNGSGDLIHNTRLLIVDPHGRLTNVVDNDGWNPRDVAAVAEHVSGESSSFVARIDFGLTNAIAGLCGGSYQTASGILDAIVALVIIVAGFMVLGWMRRRMFAQGS